MTTRGIWHGSQRVFLRARVLIASRDPPIANSHQRAVSRTPDDVTLARTRAALHPEPCRAGRSTPVVFVSRERTYADTRWAWSNNRLSGRQAPAGLLHRRQSGPGLCEGTRANIDPRGLLSDRDRLTGRRVATLTRLLGRLDPDRQLHQAADAHLLGIPELLEHDLLERPENTLGLSATDIGPVSDGVRELYLG